MDRLTVRESASYDLIKMNNEWCIDYCKEQPVQTCRDCAINEAIQKLAYYEDLEESGRLIINPYKLNDIVYIINEDNKVEETYIDGFEIRRLRDGFELFILIPICDDIRQTGYQTMLQSGVFLTREEAELKLKEMK